MHWDHWRRTFAHRLLLGLLLAGDTMLTAIVRHFPNKGCPLRHRDKAADRMLGSVELLPVAAQQTELFGAGLDDEHVIAVDISDIAKKYAEKMACLGTIHDGSTGDTAARGFNLVSATSPSSRAWPSPSSRHPAPLRHRPASPIRWGTARARST